MKPEEQRVALAKWDGWTNIQRGPYDGLPFGRHKTHELLPLPDYLNDLNEVHKLENLIDGNEMDPQAKRYEYSRLLYDLVAKQEKGFRQPFRATAPQRCEALLRTLGLWKESE